MKEIYIGCSGWSYPEWKGPFYPENLASQNFFPYYADHFETVEVNSTFYRFPSLKTVQGWYKKSSPHFKYSLKVNKLITHLRFFEEINKPLTEFYGLSTLLKEKMGCFLFQFPRTFTYTPHNLDRLLCHLKKEFKNAVEFRHESWWNSEVFKAFESENLIFCTVNGMDLPEELMLLGDKVYMRFHGNKSYNHSYEKKVLNAWSQKMKNLSCKETWIYFNNTRHAYAPLNALQFKSLL